MIRTPAELYSKLLSEYKLSELILCDLHKPCNKPAGHRCATILTWKLINFDTVKTEYQRGKKESQKSSVDGFTYKGQQFCFVELKGWTDFLIHHTNPDTLETEIKEQADKYDLTKKFTDSMLICQDIAKNPTLFSDSPIVFILVTDIDVDEDGTMEFYSDLMNLAETSTSWETICNRELKDKLSVLPSAISTYYVNCRKFDKILLKI